MQHALLDLSAHTVRLDGQTDFSGWRDAARRLALEGVAPEDVAWEVALAAADIPNRRVRGEGTPESTNESEHHVSGAQLKVPRAFVERAETVFCHADRERFSLLYRMLWRLQGEPHLLSIASDPDIRRFETMEKAVRRDIHKMRAFVRFRQIGEGPDERYVAWFEPEHFIVERNAAFFVRRFTAMRWSILTPSASAHWNGEILEIGPGASRRDAPADDATEELWRTYFRNIFNPARLKVKAMQAEMPKKYWKNLPEAALIADMVAGAGNSARTMLESMPSAPAPHHAKIQARHWPVRNDTSRTEDGGEATTISALRSAAEGCRRCPLWRDATQTVFGEGPDDAQVVFVGEQPGDQEDLAGKPFVGPAGKVFDAILDEADVDRKKVYVTNAVKHFKFEPRGKRRIHARPNAGEVQACRWWLDKELAILKPNLVVALGATAAQSLLGKPVAITKMRGQVVERDDGLRVFLTIHPSFILRIPDLADKAAERQRFRDDMKAVKQLMAA